LAQKAFVEGAGIGLFCAFGELVKNFARRGLELSSVPVYAWGPPKPLPRMRCMVRGVPKGPRGSGQESEKKLRVGVDWT
jgi:hypothetical protein